MLDRLVASDRRGRTLRDTPSAALSVVVHGVLVAAAVAATRGLPPSGPVVTPLDGGPVIYLAPEPVRARRAGGDPAPFPVLDPGTVVAIGDNVIVVPLTVPDGIPDPGVTLGARGYPGATPGATPSLFGGGGGEAPLVIAVAVADEPPLLLTSPEPRYPPTLRAAGIEGTVMIEVIVDTEGTPEAESVRVLSSDHAQFEAAARRVVLGARYRPGRWRGRPVRVLIRQPVEFRLM
jgi:protein TonB